MKGARSRTFRFTNIIGISLYLQCIRMNVERTIWNFVILAFMRKMTVNCSFVNISDCATKFPVGEYTSFRNESDGVFVATNIVTEQPLSGEFEKREIR